MIWTKATLAAILVASSLPLSQSRALPATARDDGALSSRSLEDPSAALLPPFDDTQDHDLDGSISHWSRHDTRAFIPKTVDDPPIIAPKPDTPTTNPGSEPADNPLGGLDPTKPNPAPASPAPENNPLGGLDPTKPDPPPANTEPKPDSDPAPAPAPSGDADVPIPAGQPGSPDLTPDKVPENLLTSACGQSQKRASACGPPHALLDPPDSIPDANAPTRVNRPTDRQPDVPYDFLDEVRREKNTNLVNDKLRDLDDIVFTQAPNKGQLRMDDINAQFKFGSDTRRDRGGNSDDFADVGDMFNSESHDAFPVMLDAAGVARPVISGNRDEMTSIGSDLSTAKASWTTDQKHFWDDEMFADFDDSALQPHMTEKRMAMLKKNGVDPRNVDFMGQTDITNAATKSTLTSICKEFGNQDPDSLSDVLMFSRDSRFPDQNDAFDAYFRTPNGKEQLASLSYYPEDWGHRRPSMVIIHRLGKMDDPDALRFDVDAQLGL